MCGRGRSSHLTLPYLTLPYLILSYLTLPYLTLTYVTLPYLAYLQVMSEQLPTHRYDLAAWCRHTAHAGGRGEMALRELREECRCSLWRRLFQV